MHKFRVAIFGCLISAGWMAYTYAAESAEDIMKINHRIGKVAGSVSEAEFHLISASGEDRVRRTSARTKLKAGSDDNRSVVKFLSPADVKGTMTLTIENSEAGKDDDMWIYLPALKKVRRLVASNKKDSFVGTDFSYADVIGYKFDEWNYRLLREEAVDAIACYVIEAIPRQSRVMDDSGYSKRIGWINKANYTTVRGEVYDVNGELLKTFRFSEHKLVDAKSNKWVPMLMEAENTQSKHKTVIKIQKYDMLKDLPEAEFSAKSLQGES